MPKEKFKPITIYAECNECFYKGLDFKLHKKYIVCPKCKARFMP